MTIHLYQPTRLWHGRYESGRHCLRVNVLQRRSREGDWVRFVGPHGIIYGPVYHNGTCIVPCPDELNSNSQVADRFANSFGIEGDYCLRKSGQER